MPQQRLSKPDDSFLSEEHYEIPVAVETTHGSSSTNCEVTVNTFKSSNEANITKPSISEETTENNFSH